MDVRQDHYPVSRLFLCIWMALLIITAIYVRVNGAGGYYYHPDEIMHIDIAKGSSLGEVFNFSLHETHPPLGHILRHYWQQIDGGIAFERGLSLVFGIALIPLYYLIGNRLGGTFSGLCASALATFSHGLIVQSYVVRNYTIFVFFLSLGFYCYLEWREKLSLRALLLYALFAILGCLTHLAGIFFTLPVFFYEIIRLHHRKSINRPVISQWIIANAIIIILAAITYYIWLPASAPFSFAAFHEAYLSHGQFSPADLLLAALFYAPLTSHYVLPSHAALLIIAPAVIFSAITCHKSRNFYYLTATACLLGMLLVASGSYQFLTSRRSIWILPFILPAAGLGLADCIRICTRKAKTTRTLRLTATLIFAAGFLSYDRDARFAETDDLMRNALEYNKMPKCDFDKIKDFLKSLDNKHAIIFDRSDVFLFSEENPYQYMNEAAFRKGNVLAIPYYHTYILFPSSYYDMEVSALGANEKLLKNYDTLVFTKTQFSDSSLGELIDCKSLKKEIVSFSSSAIIMVSRKEFSDRLRSADCFK